MLLVVAVHEYIVLPAEIHDCAVSDSREAFVALDDYGAATFHE